jgi:hypothetical protein
VSAIAGGKKNLKMCVRVAHIWLIPEKKNPTNIIFMNMLLVDAKVCAIFQCYFLELTTYIYFWFTFQFSKYLLITLKKACIVSMRSQAR